jgi:NADH dehydrogenase FAD-containing subunit
MNATVAVIGGGYGGIAAAQALDEVADVILVDPKDAFVHNVASLRAIVDPKWPGRMFLPYDNLLKRGQVLRDWAVSVEPRGVLLQSGEYVCADYIVIATGTTYPFPAKILNYQAETAKSKLLRTSQALAESECVLLLGAGPVGLELAGEILAVWPRKRVTIVDPASEVLSGGFLADFPAELAYEMRSRLTVQLERMGVELLLGTSIRHELPGLVGEARRFTATTWAGRRLAVDMWFRCFGRQPASRSLSQELAGARRMDSRVTVKPDLRVFGSSNVFAIGDVAETGGLDTAVVAAEQGALVAENIMTLIDGGTSLKPYEPSQPFFVVPLGPNGGVAYTPEGKILGAAETSAFKGQDLLINNYAKILGVTG